MQRPGVLPLMLFIAVASISAAAVLIRASDDAPAVVIAAGRLGIAALILMPIGVASRREVGTAFSRRHLPRMMLAGLFLGVHFFCWVTSLKHTSVVSSVVITTTSPIFVGIASHFLFHERMGRLQIGGILLACAGGSVIGLADAGHSGSLYGDLLSLCGAIMASCYFLVGRSVRKEVNTLFYILPVYTTAAVLLVATMFFMGHGFGGYRSTTYLYIVLLAVFPQLVGHSTFNWALRYMSATLIAVCILGEPIGASILAWLFLKESVSLVQGLGGGLILAGIYLTTRAPAAKDVGIDPEI